MKHLKSLSLSFMLVFVLAVAAFADETGTPSCAPGQTSSPPCTGQSVSDSSTAPGQTNTPPVSDGVGVITIVEIAVQSLLLI